MNIDNFYKYIKNPKLLQADNIAEIQAVLDAYPYFQSVHFLYLKALYQQNNFRFNDQLKKSVVYINNRKKLLYFLKEEYAFLQNSPKEIVKEEIVEDKTIAQKENLQKAVELEKKTIEKPKAQTEKPKEQQLEKFDSKKESTKPSSKASEILQDRLKELQEKKKQTATKTPKTTNKAQEIKTAPKKIEKPDILPTEVLDWIQVSPPSDYFEKTEKLQSLQESDEKLTFKEWVAKLNAVFEEREKREAKKQKSVSRPKAKKQDQIIDKFLENKEDKSIRIDKIAEADLAKPIVEEETDDTSFMTETLAEIYIKQGYYDKAIEGYKKLILKNPKKNGYFVSRIKKIEQLKQNL